MRAVQEVAPYEKIIRLCVGVLVSVDFTFEICHKAQPVAWLNPSEDCCAKQPQHGKYTDQCPSTVMMSLALFRRIHVRSKAERMWDVFDACICAF